MSEVNVVALNSIWKEAVWQKHLPSAGGSNAILKPVSATLVASFEEKLVQGKGQPHAAVSQPTEFWYLWFSTKDQTC